MPSEIERFWAKVSKAGPVVRPELGPCWVWSASKRPNGYGSFWMDGEIFGAYRASFVLNVGVIPDGLFVLHRCDNPPCVRPEHLFIGTQADNAKDMMMKGRNKNGVASKTHCLRGHAYSPETLFRCRNGRKSCRLCDRMRHGFKPWQPGGLGRPPREITEARV